MPQKRRVLRLTVQASAFLLLAMGIACGQRLEPPLPLNAAGTPVEVHAHRGGAWIKPENSLVAFHVAIAEIGSDSIELDLHQTSDHHIVIHHDPAINPAICLDPQGHRIKHPPLIAKMTLEQVQKYDCGTLVGLKKGTQLPQLDDVFNATENLPAPSGHLAGYDLHLKWDPNTISADDFAALILPIVKNHGLLSRVSFMNENESMLKAVRALEPTASLTYLAGKLQDSDFELMQSMDIDRVAPIGATLDAKTTDRVHALGVKLIPWVVDKPSEWDALFALKVDAIITDDPLHLRERIDGTPVRIGSQAVN